MHRRRLALRQLALGDAVGPVAEILERHPAELSGNTVDHELAGLPGGDAAHPRFGARLELAELRQPLSGLVLVGHPERRTIATGTFVVQNSGRLVIVFLCISH